VFWVERDSGLAKEVVDADLDELLGRDDGWLWLDVAEPTEQTADLLTTSFAFHPRAVQSAMERAHVPRMHGYPDHFMLILHRPLRGEGGHVHYLDGVVVRLVVVSSFRGSGSSGLFHGGELCVVDPALLDAGLLASQVAQVVQLGPSNGAPADHFELGDRGRVHREGALHADPERDLADRERLADAATLTADHDALEHLDAFAVPFHDPHVHLDGVARTEFRHVGSQEGLLDEGGLVHGNDWG